MFKDISFGELKVHDFERFLVLYVEAFPPEERRPYASVDDVVCFVREHAGVFDVLGAFDSEGRLVGFVSYWLLPGYVYVEHLAVDCMCRGAGIGGQLVRQLIGRVGDRVLLEVEPAGVTKEAKRRIGFYCRLGFSVRQEVEYVQPPYAPGLSAVPMWLMTHGAVDLNCPQMALAPLLREVYGVVEINK